ncbi:TPA: hypothetical protein VPE51_001580 [Streptococcus pyogenes]|uniref:Cytoplasmic protein n=2 Tax=Streptococcus dysgalactiae TaxID=1334 RepID=A0AB33R8H5_STREQ|nr:MULTISPECIES: hypothetical protein [Streptococcus]EQL79587.1 hypothetical protein HMPREF1225_1829 [Streptococcus pyogenes UTSW-2]HER4561996.1 hypothetical protein [Streptococcus pyogenes NGAS671]HER4570691.1 hypothetical protein [Streptococcus pyogenes NGAS653]HER4724521.1 hypothetical protein [Streptococcus pyogenes NGAS302]HER4731210.1 hypothetical protein [Streptococcus pyogenes NGAS304]HER4770899.1 hypothetical protein [Streptococcus pyogenes NGAS226]HER4777015.1 hypothetical protein 
MFLENEFNYFISTRNNLELVIDSLVLMIPDREFYYPEIQTGELRDYQIDIYDLIKIGYVGVYEIQKDYEDKLRELADFKRKLLKFGLLMQPLEKQKEIVIRLAAKYHLEKRILMKKEMFRDEEVD